MSRKSVPVALSIAGSDSGGGAGVQADLKAFARCGVHGTTAITAITAQNTVGVELVEPVSSTAIVAQVRAVVSDIGVDAVKIGMLGTPETVVAVVQALELIPAETPVVVDPVMASESGAELLSTEARSALVELILPRATVVTPNLSEARALAENPDGESTELARFISELGPAAVLITGGHTDSRVDLLFDGNELREIPGEFHPGAAAHGSGCTHSAALAAALAQGQPLFEAACSAKTTAAEAVRDGLHGLGAGAGPVDVFGLTGNSACDGVRWGQA